MKILLIRTDHLGDLVLMTPLIRALARGGHVVDLLTLRGLAPVFQENIYLRETCAIEDVAPVVSRDWWKLRNWMRGRTYDVLLLPNPKPRELLWASLASGIPRRLTMQAGIWGRLTAHECLRTLPSMMGGRHYSDLQLDFARALQVEPDGLHLDYFFQPQEIAEAQKKLRGIFPEAKDEPLIGIHPGSMGNTCNLPASVYGEVANLLLERTPYRIILTGSKGERSLLSSWSPATLQSSRVYNSMGELDLRALSAMISHMSNYVIGSTGPLHLASALGIRTTSPFCPLPPISASVWGNRASGTCVGPEAECCQKWRSQAPPHQHCDFRGEITAETLFNSLTKNVTQTSVALTASPP